MTGPGRGGPTPTPPDQLTAREAEVINCLARGATHHQAAADLGISHKTINNHLEKARQRMGAQTTLHLLALAIHHGQIDPDCAEGTTQPHHDTKKVSQ